MTTASPQTVSHYRLLEVLGSGAMGEVWLAEDTQLPRQVAVKMLPRHLAEDRDAVERLQREAQAAASVDHPAVVTVYEAGIEGGRPYLVMQKVEGETLEARLEKGPLEVAETVGLGLEIADALAEVHALGIVHRDLKPGNIVMSPRGPRVLDFGVASIKGAPQLTATGSAIGTPVSMSPEQIRGLPPDNRSDLWSLGVILYRALTGRAPFSGESMEAVAYQVLNHQPAEPGKVRPQIDRDLDYIVMKLLRKDPASRYSRAEDLIADLRSWSASTSGPGGAARSGQDGESAAPVIPRIAVLYFEVMSADPDDGYLAAGLTDDLIVDLTRVEGVHVASRAEVQPYRERAVPPRTLARELGVDYVLAGSVRRAGKRARISAQLVRASDTHVLWAERFDRTLEDLFDVQTEVSKRIVEALQIALRPGEREMLDRIPTKSAEAYTFYLRAREIIDTSREENRRAEVFLKRALELDPDFALGHATLGECYAWRGLRWWADVEIADKAVPHVERALELDPGLVEALVVKAMIHRLRGEREALHESLEEIIRKAPNHPQALDWAGWSYLSLGQPQKAIELLERLMHQSDALYPLSFLASAYETVGRIDDMKAVREVEQERLIERIRKHPEDARARAFLGIEMVRRGQLDEGLKHVSHAVQMDPHDYRHRYNAACAYARAGMPEKAIEELKHAVSQMGSYISDWPAHDPDLVSLHDHPEFKRMFLERERARR